MGKIAGVIIIIIVVAVGFILVRSGKEAASEKMAATTGKPTASTPTPAGPVKEFSTTAYFDETGVWYSLKEMRVKKGDVVRVKATNTKGMHDFTLDEFGVKKELPLNEEVTIEFVADKTGEFVYYCSKPGHRAKGQWGTLIVE
jgi:heme/copper-type cytochrome/quinol oxidase subunit 2